MVKQQPKFIDMRLYAYMFDLIYITLDVLI